MRILGSMRVFVTCEVLFILCIIFHILPYLCLVRLYRMCPNIIVYDWSDKVGNRRFNLSCQGVAGGFSKTQGARADILHSYFSVCGLSLMRVDENRIRTLYAPWGMSLRAASVPTLIHTCAPLTFTTALLSVGDIADSSVSTSSTTASASATNTTIAVVV